MAKYNGLNELFIDMATSIRTKSGNDDKIKLEDFPSEIDRLPKPERTIQAKHIKPTRSIINFTIESGGVIIDG